MTQESIDSRRQELRVTYQQVIAARYARNPHSTPWHWYSGVYFIEIQGFIKIGYACDVRSRLKAYDLHSPFTPIPLGFVACESEADALALERSLHEAFVESRLKRREWFKDDPAIRGYVREHAGLWPAPKQKVQ